MVDEEGSYCGGVIAPGVNLSIEALLTLTALLPRIVVEKPDAGDRHEHGRLHAVAASSGAMSA